MDFAPTKGDLMLMGRVFAGIELLGRSGVAEVELAYDDDEPEKVTWWCGGNWSGVRKFSEHFPYPAQAVEDLLSKVIDGGLCRRCEKTTVIGIEAGDRYCCFILEATDLDDTETYHWVRSCEVDDTNKAASTERGAG